MKVKLYRSVLNRDEFGFFVFMPHGYSYVDVGIFLYIIIKVLFNYLKVLAIKQ